MTKVSIVVPIYNIEKYLRRCLDSLVNQTYCNLEILCVNDGSKDGSQDIVDEYAEKYSYLKGYIKKNGGLSDARNFAIPLCTGDYIMFVDSDDWLDTTAIEKMAAVAEKYHADIVSCNMEYVYESRRESGFAEDHFEPGNPQENNDLIFINNSACNKLFKKELLNDFHFPVGMWYEDLASVPGLLAKSEMIAMVDEPLYKYFQRMNSISNHISPNEKVFDIYQAIEMAKEEILNMDAYRDSVYIRRKFSEQYIIHGADLTTLRIVRFDSEIDEYLKKNRDYLNKCYPKWYRNHLVREMGFKKHVLFFLLKHRCTKVIKWLLRG